MSEPLPETEPRQPLPGYRFRLPERVLTPPGELTARLPEPLALLDPVGLFGREAPLEVEIGVGKGRFLVASIEAHPEINYLGAEWNRRFFVWTLKRLVRRTARNVRLMNCDARVLVRHCLPAKSVGHYHIYFPDPWPKKRHRKRRLFTPDFLDDLARTLQPDGSVHTATDYLEYGEEIAALFAGHPAFATVRDELRTTGEGFTNFEAKWLRQEKPIRHFRFGKLSKSA
jgi:tRNA (guanine-N7-)-methyltransferase